ncbi:MAG: hypothetical protein ACRC3Y_05645 [Romboutsia sp.]|uniref:hypothetical protein n=1 Tax=Romboutsia sp. TaxID=1965302 RepID=UPI003F3FE102
MSESKKIIVSGQKIIDEEILDISTTLKNNTHFFLTGVVYSPSGEPIIGAAILVYEIDDSINPKKKEFVGITFTIEGGIYGISLLIDKTYSMVAYS